MILEHTPQQPEEYKSLDTPQTRKRPLPDITTSLNLENYKKKSHYQTYVPNEPMSKEELKQWRTKQRRLRNRQSAAASRQKVRDHIVRLEDELQTLQEKYDAAMKRLQLYEPSVNTDNLYEQPDCVVSYTPSVVSDVSMESKITPSPTTNSCNVMDSHVEQNQMDNVEPQLVDEQLLTDINDSEDDDMKEFLMYAFSENG